MRVYDPVILYDDGKHKFIWLGKFESDTGEEVPTNQYLIVHEDKGYLLDPGGYYVFQFVFENVTKFVKPENIAGLLFSHEDPDVVGVLNMWSEMAPNAKIYISRLWTRFLPHLGTLIKEKTVAIPDEGMTIDGFIKAIPAHFLHSPGNFHFYDTVSKIYFSGDVGSAILGDKWYLFVENFDEHAKLMEPFHRWYMASKKAIDVWLKHIEGLEISMIAPQHGAIFQGENVKKFLQWIKSLDKVGVDLLN